MIETITVSEEHVGDIFNTPCPNCGGFLFLDTDGKRFWAQCDDHAKCNYSADLTECVGLRAPVAAVRGWLGNET